MKTTTLAPADISAIAVQVAELFFARYGAAIGGQRPAAVLSLDEAVKFAGKRSRSAFQRWNKRFGPCDCGHGRYSRERLERALDRESRK